MSVDGCNEIQCVKFLKFLGEGDGSFAFAGVSPVVFATQLE